MRCTRLLWSGKAVPSFARSVRLLGLPTGVNAATLSTRAVKAAYLKQAMACHPDVSTAPDAGDAFRELTAALQECIRAINAHRTGSDAGGAVPADGDAGYRSVAEQLHDLYAAAGTMRRDAQRCRGTYSSDPAPDHSIEAVVSVSLDAMAAHAAIQTVERELPQLLTGSVSFTVVSAANGDGDSVFTHAAMMDAARDALPRVVAKLCDEVPALLSRHSVASESLAMRPLPLMGVLGVVRDESHAAAAAAAGDDDAAGDTWPEDLSTAACCRELRCLVRLPSHSVLSGLRPVARQRTVRDAMVPPVRAWMRASVARIAAERRVATAAASINAVLGLRGPLQVAYQPNASLTLDDVTVVARQLEGFLVDAAGAQGAPPNVLPAGATGNALAPEVEDLDALTELQQPAADRVELQKHITVVRLLADATHIEAARRRQSCDGATESASDSVTCEVKRAASACTAETLAYSIDLHLPATWAALCDTLRAVFSAVAARVVDGTALLPTVVEARAACEEGAGVVCFPRVFDLELPEEHRFWTHVRRSAASIAQSQQLANAFDVHGLGDAAGVAAGWCGRTRDGGDVVTIGPDALRDDAAFDAWLEDALIQSCHARRADATLAAHNARNVVRHDDVAAAHFLHFVTRYVTSAARGALEAASSRGGRAAGGVPIVVWNRGIALHDGALHVPWHVDPSELVGAVGSDAANWQLEGTTVEI